MLVCVYKISILNTFVTFIVVVSRSSSIMLEENVNEVCLQELVAPVVKALVAVGCLFVVGSSVVF